MHLICQYKALVLLQDGESGKPQMFYVCVILKCSIIDTKDLHTHGSRLCFKSKRAYFEGPWNENVKWFGSVTISVLCDKRHNVQNTTFCSKAQFSCINKHALFALDKNEFLLKRKKDTCEYWSRIYYFWANYFILSSMLQHRDANDFELHSTNMIRASL